MAQEADVALYRVQERALRPKRWKLNTNANASAVRLCAHDLQLCSKLPPSQMSLRGRSDVVKTAGIVLNGP